MNNKQRYNDNFAGHRRYLFKVARGSILHILDICSPREKEVAELISEGFNKSEAANILGVSRWRVRRCIDRIRGKVEKMRLAA
jgi:DNA-binding CsgD family transcriptional regulator